MCGISGVLAPRGDAMRAARAMHATLAHRGPDGEGIDETPHGILCHRRLSIIDLSPTGAQPMYDAQNLVRITYNGEIYNYRELRDECIRRGSTFLGTSDTEVVLNLYLLDGAGAFARLSGMYAFALVDERDGTSWLVRDPEGIKPLYAADSQWGLLFASELKALLEVLPADVDQRALQAYVQMDFVPSPMSIVTGVEKVLGVERVNRDGRRERIELRSQVEVPPGAASPLEDFDAAIRASVARHLLADVPVGVLLSGGIDSSIVARVATDLAGPVSTFSIEFDDPSFDESRWASMAARAISSRHHSARLTATDMMSLVPTVASVASEPLADGSIFPTMLLSKFVRQHVKVALSGDGADELFGGYPTHRLVRAGRMYALLPRAVRGFAGAAAHRLLPVSHRNLSLDFRIRKFLDGADRDPVVQNMQWLGSFLPEELPSLLQDFDPSAQAALESLWHEPARGGSSEADAILRTDRRFYMRDQVLVKVDRASMASSLEVRVPMLDPAVIAVAERVPISERRNKALLRRWAAEHFPQELVRRPKKGFGTPLAAWFRGPLRSLLHDTLSPETVERDGFFRGPAISRLLENHDRGRRDERKRLFNVLMFTLWLRTFRSRASVFCDHEADAETR